MKPTVITVLLLLACGIAAGDGIATSVGTATGDETESQHPQWAKLMEEAREAWGSGDADKGTEKLLLAIELAKDFASPIALARSLDMAGEDLTSVDLDEALKVLEEARSIKEAEEGPRSAGIADTLIIMASVVSMREALANPRRDDEPDSYLLPALELYKEARDIRREVFGEGACEVGAVDVSIGIVFHALGQSDRAERIYREVLTYCPLSGPDAAEGDVGFSAEAALLCLLYGQGREEEAEEIIYAQPAIELKPAEAAADPEPRRPDRATDWSS